MSGAKMEKDPTGVVLSPGELEKCMGNGKHEGIECCCDECDFYLLCFGSDRKEK